MGIAERKERDRVEMKRRIIDVAMKMFVEEGYEKTSIRNIAEKIEYSPTTLYLYYKDKDELLYDVQKECFEKLDAEFEKKATAKDPYERLKQICHTYVHYGIDHPELYDLMFIIRAPMNVVEDQELWTNGKDCMEFFLTCIGECIEQDKIRYTDQRLAALSIWSMGHGLVSLQLRCRFKVMELEDSEIPGVIDAAIDDYLRLLKK